MNRGENAKISQSIADTSNGKDGEDDRKNRQMKVEVVCFLATNSPVFSNRKMASFTNTTYLSLNFSERCHLLRHRATLFKMAIGDL